MAASSRAAGWPYGMEFDIDEVVPDVVIEVPVFGFGLQQFLIDLRGKAEGMIPLLNSSSRTAN